MDAHEFHPAETEDASLPACLLLGTVCFALYSLGLRTRLSKIFQAQDWRHATQENERVRSYCILVIQTFLSLRIHCDPDLYAGIHFVDGRLPHIFPGGR